MMIKSTCWSAQPGRLRRWRLSPRWRPSVFRYLAWEPAGSFGNRRRNGGSIPSNDDQMPVEIDFARSKGWKRVALINDNSAFGKDTAEITRAVVKEKGLELVADESYAPSDTDVTAQVTRLRAASPDLILNLAGGIPTGLLVAKKAIQLGIKAPLMQGLNFVVDSYPPLVPQAIDQSYFAGSKMMVDLPSSDLLYPNIAAFRKKHAELRGPSVKPNGNTIIVADILLLVKNVGQSLGSKF